ncbi:chromosome segregation protein SMC [Legionella londiniensis]|uniref:chromosome segregation protein SMC n=1 Tax=Legionella londiniensis TaxID=45068 RepID=UPI00399CEAA7
MHLKQIKLAGFKSFVEPTAVPFPSQLVAVVGPNGCGKSNIIDAVRWVMGESSAKNLRGESMVDVIFNGSLNRKPVGQASVELVFDNTLGRLGAQYANYQEISLKRVVTRDNETAYYLNGSRCRRRDIQDIFLGTGAGARGYAIIGQDMISKIIEARPDELKYFFEEAAGVSKYKDRRRETLQRIGHTQENLARLSDILEELQKQIARLERQAKAAQRYKALKEEERLYKAEILALKWNALKQEEDACEHALNILLLQEDGHQKDWMRLENEHIQIQTRCDEKQNQLQDEQACLYQLGKDIAKLEEVLQQRQQERQRLHEDYQQVQREIEAVTRQLQSDQDALKQSEESFEYLQKDLQEKILLLQQEIKSLQAKEQRVNEHNEQWQRLQTSIHKAQQNADYEKMRLTGYQQRQQEILVRHEKLNCELNEIQIDELYSELRELEAQKEKVSEEQSQASAIYRQLEKERSDLQKTIAALDEGLRQLQIDIHGLSTDHAAMEAAQNAALKTANEASHHPLWQNYPRLVEVMAVSEPWLPACEWVLAECLHATVVDSLSAVFDKLSDFQGQALTFVTEKAGIFTPDNYPLLSDKITGLMPEWQVVLQDVYTAETLEEARSWLPNLKPQQSVVTLDGYWLGHGWLRFRDLAAQKKEGFLYRQQALLALKQKLDDARRRYESLIKSRELSHAELANQTMQVETARETLSAKKEALQILTATILNKQQNLKQAESRKNRLSEELQDLQEQTEIIAEEITLAQKKIAAAHDSCAYLKEQQHGLYEEKKGLESELNESRQSMEALRQQSHQTELKLAEEKIKIKQLQDNLLREEQRSLRLKERLQAISGHLESMDNPKNDVKPALADLLLQYARLEDAISQKRQDLSDLQDIQSNIARQLRQAAAEEKQLKEHIQQFKMQKQALHIRREGLNESLAEYEIKVPELLSSLPAGLTVEQREEALSHIKNKINALGAINLIAIEEYQAELQRQEELKRQYQDLQEALMTLDAAITRMDKETEMRLRDTFTQVNTAFQSLFPRLFGGGRALLELTCDNLLEAGILVMAQPPGKRNSTIHMLSGGEKAMTAVALVFAFFQLNPAPFCMLDEVDAPLDDANVRRFCDLVKEMSQFVQFLFITHNKITMELADHLIGVTMREPGVSRIVAVDVEQALSIVK